MVENTVEIKTDRKKGPVLPKTLAFIAAGIFIALVFSVYWRINHARDFLGNGNAMIPEINKINGEMNGLEDIIKQAQGQSSDNTDPYKIYTTPDGYLSIRYPSSFADGKNVMEQAMGTNLDSTNFLLYAYKFDTSFSAMKPITLVAARYDATSTEDVAAQIKNALDKQLCQSDIKESEAINSNTAYRMFDSTYKCGDQGDLSLWQARTAIIRKNDTEFYAVTGATISKNWEAAKLEINSMLESISINRPTPEISPENPAETPTNNQPQNNETAD